MTIPDLPSLDLSTVHAAYATGQLTPCGLVELLCRRIAAAGDDAVWISRVTPDALHERAAALERLWREMPPEALPPLFGIPFAVKDNIDIAGLPTTAGCPAFAYRPDRTAPAVARLEAAGAILVGKTNLDQFATGLVGTRSPYGTSRNPFDARYMPGGSSSGSAVAVASGFVSFALGTDTAGSGRVPAACTNIVGLKPTRGLLSTSGTVPACRSLDCLSVFALTVADAVAVVGAAAGVEADDPYSRPPPSGAPAAFPDRFRFGVPRDDQLTFFGDEAAERLFADALAAMTRLGGTAVTIDFAPFAAATALLYDGPWLAERWAAVGDFIDRQPEAVLPVTRDIISRGRGFTAADAFRGQYRLQALRRQAAAAWDAADLLLLPTCGTIYRLEEIAADPVGLNSRLGIYTNFVNLLDLAALAVPAGFRPNGLPFGVTLVGPAFSDLALARLGSTLLGEAAPAAVRPPATAAPTVGIAVVGSHLSGQPLNHQIVALGGRLRRTCRTSPRYRLFALPDGEPQRPGMVRVGTGHAIEAEVWEVPLARLGELLAQVPAPLAIGRVELDDGEVVLGFLCEAYAVENAADISAYGGWRAWRAAGAGRDAVIA